MSQNFNRPTLAVLAITALALSPLAGAQNINDISNVGKPPSQVLNLYVFPKGEKTPAQQLLTIGLVLDQMLVVGWHKGGRKR